MSNRTVIRGGTVLSMDRDIGDLPRGDVLVEDGTIVAVEPIIGADAEAIDAEGFIVIPGFVDTHRHTWQAAIRGCAADSTLDDYYVEVLDTYAPVYEPDDVYVSNLAGALECLNAGITTVADWSHINNTPEHADAAVRGLQEAGIRAQYAYGGAHTSLSDYLVESRVAIPADDARRVRDTHFSAGDGLLSMALAARGPGFCHDEVVVAEWRLARELDIPITVHTAMGRLAGRWAMVERLDTLGLLGPDVTYVHCCYFSEQEWQRVADTGGTVSVAPQVEVQMGHGHPAIMKAMEYGLRPALSTDVMTAAPGDMFTQIRTAFGAERQRVLSEAWRANTDPPADLLTARDMLAIATINGAYVTGLESRTGSLTPGKRADIVMLDARAINMVPVIDPVASVTLCADVSNVDTVLVDGVVRKRNGKLLADTEAVRQQIESAHDRLTKRAQARLLTTAAEEMTL